MPWDPEQKIEESDVELSATIKFTKKGWFSGEQYKLEGDVQRHLKGQKP